MKNRAIKRFNTELVDTKLLQVVFPCIVIIFLALMT